MIADFFFAHICYLLWGIFLSLVDPRNFAYSIVFRVMVDDFCLHLVYIVADMC